MKCSFAGCHEPKLAKGLCSSHYAQQRHGVPLHPVRKQPRDRSAEDRSCSVAGCVETRVARGRCKRHYQEWRREHGEPCSFEGCAGRVLSKGLCPGHYTQQREGKSLVPLLPPVIIESGARFGLWTVLEEVPKGGRRHRTVRVRCACGKESLSSVYTLANGSSSGCHKCRAPHGDEWACWTGAGKMHGSYWGRVLAGAASRGLPVEITKEDAWVLFEAQGGVCALSGVSLHFKMKCGTASLDRIDSSKGYVTGNCQWVHKDVNMMKGSMPDAEFREWCLRIGQHIRSR